MDFVLPIVLTAVVAAVLGAGIVYLLTRNRQPAAPPIDEAGLRAQIQSDVEASLKERLLEAKEAAVQIRTEAEKEARETRAKAICAACSVRRPCLDYALRIREPHGIWGGLNEAERKALLARRAG